MLISGEGHQYKSRSHFRQPSIPTFHYSGTPLAFDYGKTGYQ